MASMKPTSKPSANPGASSPFGEAQRTASDGPTMIPPSASVAQSDCGCSGEQAAGAAASIPGPPPGGGAMAAPSMMPGAVTAAGGATAVWRNNMHILGLWSINQDKNAWIFIDNNVGWRRLATQSESGLMSLNALAANAYEMNAAANVFEENDGTISQIYVW
jgi:hypothetical protein